jgi:hypothetical protein
MIIYGAGIICGAGGRELDTETEWLKEDAECVGMLQYLKASPEAKSLHQAQWFGRSEVPRLGGNRRVW